MHVISDETIRLYDQLCVERKKEAQRYIMSFKCHQPISPPKQEPLSPIFKSKPTFVDWSEQNNKSERAAPNLEGLW